MLLTRVWVAARCTCPTEDLAKDLHPACRHLRQPCTETLRSLQRMTLSELCHAWLEHPLHAHDHLGMTRLREVRQARGLTQRELGIVVALTQAGIAKIESGERHLSPEARIRVVRALGLSIEDVRSIPEVSLQEVQEFE